MELRIGDLAPAFLETKAFELGHPETTLRGALRSWLLSSGLAGLWLGDRQWGLILPRIRFLVGDVRPLRRGGGCCRPEEKRRRHEKSL